jgi:ATP-dependent Clp protease protease subunit
VAKEEKEKEEFKSLDDKIDNVILESRRIFFSEQVDNNSARDAIRKLWYLELTNPGKPIVSLPR